MKLVCKAAEIITYVNPKFYVIENPVGLLRQFLPEDDRKTVSYCMYGYPYRKNTDLWTDVPFTPRRCVSGSYCFHKKTFGVHGQHCQSGRKARVENGMKKFVLPTCRLIDRYSLPPELLRDIFKAMTVSLRIRIRGVSSSRC